MTQDIGPWLDGLSAGWAAKFKDCYEDLGIAEVSDLDDLDDDTIGTEGEML